MVDGTMVGPSMTRVLPLPMSADHTWGRDNPTCMRLYSAPTSKTALSGSGIMGEVDITLQCRHSGSAGTAVDGIPGSSIREKPQGGPSNGG